MKKTLLFLFGLFFTVLSASANGGWADCAVNVSKDGSEGYLYSLGNENWADGIWLLNTVFDAYDFGTPTSLVLNGGIGNAWTDDTPGYNSTSFVLYYRVYKTGTTPGSWSQIALDNLNRRDGYNYIYDKTNAGIDILALATDLGTYVLEVAMSKNQFYAGGNWISMIPGGQTVAYDPSISGYKATFTKSASIATPTVTGISPSSGTTAGGTTVTITGTNFTGATAVKFGSANATSFTVNSATQITAVCPAGSAGTADITVTTAEGASATSSADQFTYVAAPAANNALNFDGTNDMVSVSPFPTANGTISFTAWVKLNTTTGFQSFGSWAYSGDNLLIRTFSGDLQLIFNNQAISGGAIPAGSWQHIAFTKTGFTFNLYVNGVLKSSGNLGTLDRSFTAFHLGSLNGTMHYLNGEMDDVAVWNKVLTETEIQSISSAPLTGNESNLLACYNFDNGASGGNNAGLTTLEDVSPNSNNGTLNNFTLTGTTSNWVKSTVFTPSVSTQAVSSIATTTATGNGNITKLGIDNPTQYGVVWSKSTNPTVALTNKTAQGAIAATGAFTSSITGLESNTTYYVKAYATNTAGTSYGSEVSFTTLPVAPTVTAISPTAGSTVGGTTVTITGTNLTDATAVKFGSTNATSFTVNSATQITATSPAGIAGAVDITVTTAGGTSATSAADQFTYVAAPTVTTNVATSISSTGATLNGSINANGASTAVKFEYGLTTSYGKAVTAAQSPVTGVSATGVSYALSGLTPNTTYHYRVVGVNAGGTANGQDQTFTTGTTALTESFYEQTTLPFAPTDDVDMSSSTLAPTMYLPSTNSSYPSKGYKVTLLKSGKISLSASSNEIATNQFAFLVSTSYDASSSSQKYIAVGNGTTATLTPGTYYIILLTDNKYGKFKLNITFAALPNITSISPTSGTTAGGTTVTITGTDFTNATAVKFGSTAATSFTVNSATQITATSPARSAGAVDITVTTAGGTSTTSTADQFVYQQPQAITFNALSTHTYGDAPFVLAATGGASGNSVVFTSSDPTVATCTGTNGATITLLKAGSCTITANQAGNASYDAATPVSQTLTVNALPVTVTANVGQSKLYGESDPAFTYSVSPELIAGDAFTGALAREAGETVGTYAIHQGTLSAGANYAISFVGDNFNITAKPITVTVGASQSKVYGESDAAFTYSVSPVLKAGDAFTGALAREAGETVGTYAIHQGTLSAGANYAISFVGDNFNITAKPITVTVGASQSKVYGESDAAFTYSVSPVLKAGDAFTGALAREAGETVGTYAIHQGTLSAGANYAISFVGDNFNITAKPITVTVGASQSKVYGESDAAFTYSVSPVLKAGDAFTGALAREAGENVGTYAINQGTLSAGDNYTISFVGDNFNITAKPITVTANASQSKVYGESDPAFTYSVNPAMKAGDAFTGALARAVGENVGNYAILQGTLSAGSNYTISFESNKLAIMPKQLTATTQPSVVTIKLYDGNTKAQIVSLGALAGAVASDAKNLSLSGEANYNDASVGNKKSITVVYALGGSAASNYLAPASYVIWEASIQDKITLATLSAPAPSCPDDDILLNYQVLSGTPDSYTLTFGSQALLAGFSNKENIPVTGSIATGYIAIKVPSGIAGGTYTANLKMKGILGNESPSYPFTFTVNLSTDYLKTKFNDVILFDNASNLFNSFQWYKNGQLIEGATKQFYNDPEGLSGSYYVAVTTTAGEKLRTCDKIIVRTTPAKPKISVYPNPVKRNQTTAISFSGIEEQKIESATLIVYKINGEKVYVDEHISKSVQLRLNLPTGIYIGNMVTSDKEVYSFKVVIE